jgi:hypothetical protein
MIREIVAGLEMAGRVSGALAGVELGRRVYRELTGETEADDVSGHEETAGGGYPLLFRADPLHLLTPTPAEWELSKSLRSQGKGNAEIRATLAEHRAQMRAIRAGGAGAQAAAEDARADAERWEGDRTRAALQAARAGDTRRARAEARAAILSRRFRGLSQRLNALARSEGDPAKAAALDAQAAATSILAKTPPTAADVPQASDRLSTHVRGLLSAVSSRAGEGLDSLAERIAHGAPLEDGDDWGDELSAEEALSIVSGEDEAAGGELVSGCGCGGSPSPAPLAHVGGSMASPEDRDEMLLAFQAMGAADVAGAPEPAAAVAADTLAGELRAWGAGVAEFEQDALAGVAPPEGSLKDLLAVFQGAKPRAAKVAR